LTERYLSYDNTAPAARTASDTAIGIGRAENFISDARFFRMPSG
jgi:hypothetical protein